MALARESRGSIGSLEIGGKAPRTTPRRETRRNPQESRWPCLGTRYVESQPNVDASGDLGLLGPAGEPGPALVARVASRESVSSAEWFARSAGAPVARARDRHRTRASPGPRLSIPDNNGIKPLANGNARKDSSKTRASSGGFFAPFAQKQTRPRGRVILVRAAPAYCRSPVLHRYAAGDSPMSKFAYEIDGCDFTTLDEFFDVISRVLIPGAEWGHNLDAFNDILRGGFGTPHGGFVIRWVNSALSRERLGHAEMVRQLEDHLMYCHPSNRSLIVADLARARQGLGPTVFDWLVEIIEHHGAGGQEQVDGVELILA